MSSLRPLRVLVALALAAAVSLAAVRGQEEPARRGTAGAGATFTGTSEEGSFQEALDAAVAQALAAASNPAGGHPVSDAMVDWELERVAGRQGGIAGFRRVEVTIRVAPR